MAGIGDPSHSNSTMRVGLPVAPRRRFIYVFKCPNTANAPKGVTPMVIDTSGLYFRREINQASYITGISPPEVYNNTEECKLFRFIWHVSCIAMHSMKTTMDCRWRSNTLSLMTFCGLLWLIEFRHLKL